MCAASEGIVEHGDVAGRKRELVIAARTDIGMEPRCTGM